MNYTSDNFGLENIEPEFLKDERERIKKISEEIAEWYMNAEEDEITKHLAKCNQKALVRIRNKINAFLNSDPRDDSIK